MTYSSLVRPAWLLAAAAAFGGCSGGTSSTSSAPAPATAAASARAASSAAARPAGGMPAGVTAAMVAEGDSLFHARSCRNCHGPDAKGRTNGPDLTSGKFLHVNGSYDDFVRIITSGVPAEQIKDKTHTLAMNPRGGGRPPLLTDDQVKAIAAYVYSLNHK
jgi:mono/diheme cytochrome c family protein